MTCKCFCINGERVQIDRLNTRIFNKAFVKKHLCTPISNSYWFKKFNFFCDYDFSKIYTLGKFKKNLLLN